MAIVLREVSDEDVARACEIEFLAYRGNPLSPILALGLFPADSGQQRVDQVVQMRKDDPTVHYMQAVDEYSGKMFAFAKWHIFESSEVAKAASRPLSFGAGRNVEACMAFFGGMKDRKEQLMGSRPHFYLHLLHTDPEFQSRGAGSQLVQWGPRKADELGLPTYLESSTAGHHFYQKHGFYDVEVTKIDFS